MTKYISFFASLLLFASCNQLSEKTLHKEVKVMSQEERIQAYDNLKIRINNTALSYKDSLKSEVAMNNLSNYLHNQLTDSICPYWYGTPWDFNGVSVHPQLGNIACGYFVTTTLKHCGLKLERAKLAQQAASKIINSLCAKGSIKSFSNHNYAGLKKFIDNQPDGVYIIGLDNHVAFVSKKGTDIRAIHSAPPAVKNQYIHECASITKSGYHVIGSLTGNKALIKKWVNQEAIQTKL